MDTSFSPAKEPLSLPPQLFVFLSSPQTKLLVSQWEGELASRAPSLKVLNYAGLQALPLDFDVNDFLEYDVILTTYPILSKELHYVIPQPDRCLRYKKIRPIRRSPLMEFGWWRVCIDEAQMIEGSVTSAATVARLIPRIVSSAPRSIRMLLICYRRILGVSRGHPVEKMYPTFTGYSPFYITSRSLIIWLYGKGSVVTGQPFIAFSTPSYVVIQKITSRTKCLFRHRPKRCFLWILRL